MGKHHLGGCHPPAGSREDRTFVEEMCSCDGARADVEWLLEAKPSASQWLEAAPGADRRHRP